jgi:lipoprotein-anchoring transpeptidase ErfK/SrfK
MTDAAKGGPMIDEQRRAVLAAALGGGLSILAVGGAVAQTVPRTLGRSTREDVDLATEHRAGTILVNAAERHLHLVTVGGRALRYRIGVGRDGFGWSGRVVVGSKAEWPSWRPPAEMRARRPDLPEVLPPGPLNPLGARALYLYRNGADTLYRIHGTNDETSVGTANSSGCFRMTNTDVIDLYRRVRVGAIVIVA